MASLRGAALWYCNRGLLVFPLRPRSKVPATRRGFHDASMNPDTIRAWWAQCPEYNIGLVTGHLFDVIDVDGDEGIASLANLTASADLPEPVGLVKTPRGWHYMIPPTGDGCATALMPGIDYRGNGGYVVAPPSKNEHGTAYEWTSPIVLPDTAS